MKRLLALRALARVAGPCGLAMLIASCQTVQTTTPGAVGVERQQRMSVVGPSRDQINTMSAQQYAQAITQADKKNLLNRNPQQVQRVRAVAARLAPKTAIFRADAPHWAWDVNVITSPELNAWCMPGGKIAVYSGLIEELSLTDDELAAVMGHEIAHALREHAREKISQQAPVSVLADIASAFGYGAISQLGAQGFQLLVGLPNSREMETEADRIGIELMARAGYDPRGAITVWQKMAKASQNSSPEFLSTHPSHSTRIADLSAYAQRVMPLYEQARRGG
ncbi:MAG TPA: M48 family metallopeptidase [Burkholderiaceae bacterium]|nr:M48 family metallopeptidase [Burkholderiaceae bacterium]